MQPFGPAPPRHQATGKFVDDDDFVVLHHVVLVFVEQTVRAQRGIEVVNEDDVGGVVEAGTGGQQTGFGEQVFHALVPLLGEQHLAAFEIQRVIAGTGDVVAFAFLLGEQRRDVVEFEVQEPTIATTPLGILFLH